MSENRRRDAAPTAAAGLTGVVGGSMLRQKGLQRAHFEDTKVPIKRAKIGAERQLLRGARGRRTWLAGAGLQAAAIPAAGVGLYRIAKPGKDPVDKRDGVVVTGLRGAQDAFEDRIETQRKAPPALTGQTVAATTGASLAGSGLAALALRKKKLGPLVRSGALSGAGVVTGTASLPAQSKVIERQTKGEYTLTPYGVKRKKRAPKRPSHDATMIDTKSGQIIPSGVRKADDDPGAGLSRMKRRAIVQAAGGAPVIGDFTQGAVAGQLSAPPYRKRTATEVFAANNAGNLLGAGAGALGAAGLAQSSGRARTKMENANAKVEGVKARAADAVPDQVKNTYSGGRERVANAMPSGGKVGAGIKATRARAATTRAGRLIARHPGPAALGALAGTAAGGQAGMHLAYTRAMNRDDRYRNANRMARRGTTQVAKSGENMNRREKKDLAHRKQKAAVLSVIAGGAGMGALGATGATGALRRLPERSRLRRVIPHVDKAKTPLLAVSSGVGGYSSMNFAGMQRQEAKQLDPSIKKSLYRVRRPSVTRGHLRTRRMPSGIVRVSTVRGSLR